MASPDFLATYTPLANDISQRTNIDPSVVLGIINQETGGGQHVLGNNIFGIKSGDQITSYPDVQTAAQAFITTMQLPRYKGVTASSDPAAQATAIGNAGYGPDKTYGSIIAQQAAALRKQLGVNDNAPPGPQPAVASAPPAAGSAKARLLADPALQTDGGAGGATTTPPAAATTATTAKGRLLADPALQAPATTTPGPDYTQYAGAPDTADTATTLPSLALPDWFTRGFHPLQPDASGSALPQQPPSVTPEGQTIDAGSLGRVLEAGKAGWQGGSILTPEGWNLARQYTDPYAIGRFINYPLLQAADVATRGASALGNAGLQAVYEEGMHLGGPKLARDLATLAITTPVVLGDPLNPMPSLGETYTGAGMAGSRAFNALREADVRARAAAMATPAATGATGAADVAANWRAWAQRQVPGGAATPEGATAAEEAPAAVGAQGTPYREIPEFTDPQKIANLQKSVRQTVTDRAQPGPVDPVTGLPTVVDHEPYVEGVQRLLASREFSPRNSMDEKMFMADPQFKAQADSITNNNHIIMRKLLDDDAGDEISLDNLREERRKVRPKQYGAFDDQQPVDATPVLDAINRILVEEGGEKRDKIAQVMTNVRNKLYKGNDPNNELETMPNILYAARQNISDLLDTSKGGTDLSAAVRASRDELKEVMETLDGVIAKGAPKYDAYRQAYREASIPIDQQEFLQQFQTGGARLWNPTTGRLLPNKVQAMLERIEKQWKLRGPNAAKSLSDEQVNNIIAVRNELHAEAFKDFLATAKGSDSYQNFSRATALGAGPLGAALKNLGDVAMQGLAWKVGGPAGAGFYRYAAKPGLEAWRAAKTARQVEERKAELLSTNIPEGGIYEAPRPRGGGPREYPPPEMNPIVQPEPEQPPD